MLFIQTYLGSKCWLEASSKDPGLMVGNGSSLGHCQWPDLFHTWKVSSHNVRRLLNIIQHSFLYNAEAVVILPDAEKASDRLEWLYLFHTFQRFDLGESFIRLFKFCTHRLFQLWSQTDSDLVILKLNRVATRQGCPLSPILFAIAMEPLAFAIRQYGN